MQYKQGSVSSTRHEPDIYLHHCYAAYSNPCCNTMQFESGLFQGTWARVNQPANNALGLQCRAGHVAVVPTFQMLTCRTTT